MLQEPEVQEIAEGKVPLVFGSEVCLARFSVLALASAVVLTGVPFGRGML